MSAYTSQLALLNHPRQSTYLPGTIYVKSRLYHISSHFDLKGTRTLNHSETRLSANLSMGSTCSTQNVYNEVLAFQMKLKRVQNEKKRAREVKELVRQRLKKEIRRRNIPIHSWARWPVKRSLRIRSSNSKSFTKSLLSPTPNMGESQGDSQSTTSEIGSETGSSTFSNESQQQSRDLSRTTSTATQTSTAPSTLDESIKTNICDKTSADAVEMSPNPYLVIPGFVPGVNSRRRFKRRLIRCSWELRRLECTVEQLKDFNQHLTCDHSHLSPSTLPIIVLTDTHQKSWGLVEVAPTLRSKSLEECETINKSQTLMAKRSQKWDVWAKGKLEFFRDRGEYGDSEMEAKYRIEERSCVASRQWWRNRQRIEVSRDELVQQNLIDSIRQESKVCKRAKEWCIRRDSLQRRQAIEDKEAEIADEISILAHEITIEVEQELKLKWAEEEAREEMKHTHLADHMKQKFMRKNTD